MKRTNLHLTVNKSIWENLCNTNYDNIEECSSTVIKEGFLLPLKKKTQDKTSHVASFSGGVCNSFGTFVTGLERDKNLNFNMSVSKSYEFEMCNLPYISEEVIYGGIIMGVFGHCMTETLSRLWYIVENNYQGKIAFLVMDYIPEYFYTFMSLLNISKEQIMIVNAPTRFKSIIIPNQSFIIFKGYNKKYNIVFDAISRNALKKENSFGKKVYLSRTCFANNDCTNEIFFENFYRNQGFTIVYPEHECLEKQIAIARDADEIACTAGTLSHFILFAKENAHLTILLRENEPNAIKPQIILNQLRNVSCDIVDVSMNFLPTSHVQGRFLLGPNQNWFNYLKSKGYTYSDKEMEMPWSDTLYPYLKSWIKRYSANNYSYKRINHLDIFDVVNRMSMVLEGKTLDRASMPTIANRSNLPNDVRKEIEHLSFENKCLKKILDKLSNMPLLTYSIHQSCKGWSEYMYDGECTNNSNNRTEAIRIRFFNCDNSIYYKTRVSGKGWQDTTSNNDISGTTGISLPLTALNIWLDNKLNEKYMLLYRVCGNGEWQRWCQNGEIAGEENDNFVINDVQIKLFKK